MSFIAKGTLLLIQSVLLPVSGWAGTQGIDSCFIDQLSGHFTSPIKSSVSSEEKWQSRFKGYPAAYTLDEMVDGELSTSSGFSRLLKQIESGWDGQGIRYRRVTYADGSTGLVITPLTRDEDPSAALLNRLAAGLRKYNPNFELRYTPSAVSRGTTGDELGYMNIDRATYHPYIEMGHAAAIKGDARDVTLVHETIHAKHLGDKSRDAIHSFLARAQAVPIERKGLVSKLPSAQKRPGAYEEYLSFDELITYRHNVRQSVKDYIKALRTGTRGLSTFKQALFDDLAILQAVSIRAAETSKTAYDGLVALKRAGRLSWQRPLQFKSQGTRFEIAVHPYEEGGKSYAVLTVEEQTRKQAQTEQQRLKRTHASTLIQYILTVPVRASEVEQKTIPFEALLDTMTDLEDAANTNQRDLFRIVEKVEKMVGSKHLSEYEREKLLQEMEKAASRAVQPPGYHKSERR